MVVEKITIRVRLFAVVVVSFAQCGYRINKKPSVFSVDFIG